MLPHAEVRNDAQPADQLEAGLSCTARFRRTYVPGFDCRLATLRNTLAAAGHRFTNGMVLGLSGALCFSYAGSDRKRLPFMTIAGISDQTLEGLPAALNLYAHRSRHDPGQAAGTSLFEAYMDEGLPVHVAVFRPTLRRAQFRGSPTPVAGGAALGFHYVTLTERHPATDEFTVFETDSAIPFRITRAELMAAWFHDLHHVRRLRDPHQPCDGLWYVLQVPPRLDALSRVTVRHAVQRVVHGFFDPPVEQMGLPGLERLREDARGWHTEAVDDEALARCIHLLRVLDYHLSGGGFGRKLYGRFLSEVSLGWNDWTLRTIAQTFGRTAEAWSGFVRELQRAVPPAGGRAPVPDREAVRAAVERHLDALVLEETAQMRSLQQWI